MGRESLGDRDRILEEERLQYKRLDAQIMAAFAGVELGDGIGYFEADAIDDYLKPSDVAYQEARARDNRYDWMALVRYAKESSARSINYSAHCFMDANGLYFYLPAAMLIEPRLVGDYILHPKFSNKALFDLLTPAQWNAIIDFYEYEVDYENSVAHHSETMKPEEAVAFVERQDEFQILQWLKSRYAAAAEKRTV